MKRVATTGLLTALTLVTAQSVATAQGTFDRSKPPELGPPPRVSLPPIVTRELPNGLKLLIVEQHELPLADFVLLVGSGSTTDPVGNRARCRFTLLRLNWIAHWLSSRMSRSIHRFQQTSSSGSGRVGLRISF